MQKNVFVINAGDNPRITYKWAAHADSYPTNPPKPQAYDPPTVLPLALDEDNLQILTGFTGMAFAAGTDEIFVGDDWTWRRNGDDKERRNKIRKYHLSDLEMAGYTTSMTTKVVDVVKTLPTELNEPIFDLHTRTDNELVFATYDESTDIFVPKITGCTGVFSVRRSSPAVAFKEPILMAVASSDFTNFKFVACDRFGNIPPDAPILVFSDRARGAKTTLTRIVAH
jgi:hypothetical protein